MPYSGPRDSTLPDHVKKLSLASRRQWIRVFNERFEACKKRNGSGCDGEAMRAANGVAKSRGSKEDVMTLQQTRPTLPVQCPCGEQVDVVQGAKEFSCGRCETTRTMTWSEKDDTAYEIGPSVEYRPWGGATSFDEVDAKREANEWNDHVDFLKRVFDGIWHNIWTLDDPDTTIEGRMLLVRTAVNDLVQRISDGPEGMKEEQPGLLTRVKEALLGKREALSSSEPPMQPSRPAAEDGTPHSAFYLTKDEESGRYRFTVVHTNAFPDKHVEGFTEHAHKEFEDYLDRTRDYPELLAWHVPGARLGEADFLTSADGFVVASGMIDRGKEDAAERLRTWPEPLGASHGFWSTRDALRDDGYFEWYRSKEITVLPRARAANTWTAFSLAGLKEEAAMPLRDDKKAFLAHIFGKDEADRIEAGLKESREALASRGLSTKALDDMDDIFGKKAEEGGATGSAAAPASTTTDSPQTAQPVQSAQSAQSGQPSGQSSGNGGESGNGGAESGSPQRSAEEAERAERAERADGSAEGNAARAEGAEGAEGAARAEGNRELSGVIEALKSEIVGAVDKRIDERFGAIETKLKELGATDDEKVAAALSPRGGNGNGNGNAPSEDQRTVMDKDDAEKATAGPSTKVEGEKEGPSNPARRYVDDYLVGGNSRQQQQ